MEKYVESYENRIKGFIYQMAASPIKIKDYKNQIYSSRKELLDEENDKIIGNKGFVFKKFKTERQRIEELMEERETIYIKENMLQLALAERKLALEYGHNNSGNNSSRRENSNIGTNIIQPTMRFKARTDLERIFDSINLNSYGRVDREILEKQLRNLELNVSKKAIKDDDLEEEIPDYWTSSVKRRQKQMENDKLREERRKMLEEKSKKRKARKKVDNSLSRHFMSDLHMKTHFKGATGFTLFKNSTTADSKKFKNENSPPKSQNLDTSGYHRNSLKSQQSFIPTFTNYNSNNSPKLQTQTDYLNTFNSTSPTNTRFIKTERDLFNHHMQKGQSKSVQFAKTSSSQRVSSVYDFNDPELSSEVLQNNPLLYNIQNNPFRKKSDNQGGIDRQKLQYIKDLAFVNPSEENFLQSSPNNKKFKNAGFFKKLKSKKKLPMVTQNTYSPDVSSKKLTYIKTEEPDSILKNNPVSFFVKFGENPDVDMKKMEEEKITVDGETFLKSDIDKIAKKILTGCNFVHTKNKNNATTHKAGTGKLMMTSGMTLNEFTKKYKLK